MTESVLSLKEKNTLYISFDDFGIWLLGYRMEFSCL